MDIKRFVKEKAQEAHEGTILADDVVPEGLNPPFGHAWGYLENNSEMESHSHPTEEIYIVVQGQGFVQVGEEKSKVVPGDVVEIPPGKEHTMVCKEEGPLLWAALWWE
ncbi:MAG: cupin domain-containing protein [bacterium]